MFFILMLGLLSTSCNGKEALPSNFDPLSDELINYINSRNLTWKAARNFEPSQLSYVKSLLGVKRDNSFAQLPRKKIEISSDIPDTFDARQKWPNCSSISLIHDQSNCHASYAFAVVEALSDRICIYTKGETQVNISAEDVISCCSYCGDGCNGGYPFKVYIRWLAEGIVTGDDYNGGGCRPYSIKPDHHSNKTAVTPRCVKKCQPCYPKSYKEDLHFGDDACPLFPDQKQIQTELMHGPVTAEFLVFSDFLSYKSGVYKRMSDDFLGIHAVKIIGWGTENGTDYWLAANSWGTEWGHNGLFKIARGINECEIEDYVFIGDPGPWK